MLGVIATINAYAVVLPGTVQPQQIGQALIEQQNVQAKSSPYANIESPYQPLFMQLPPSATTLKFRLNDIILLNTKKIPQRDLRKLYAHELHKVITLQDLLNIVESITNYYRSHGYISSQAVLIPQRTKNGVVTIKIIEGAIANVNITGCPGKAEPLIRAYACKIRQQQPLNIAQMEKYLLLANEIPSTQVQGVITPTKNEPGASDITMVTNHRLMNGYLSYDDYGTRYIGPQQVTGNLGFNSLLLPGDSAQFTLAKTARGRELTFGDAHYGLALNAEGDRFLVGGTVTKTHPEFILTASDIDGLNKNYYTAFTLPAIRENNQNLTYYLGLNYNWTRVTSFDTKLYRDSLTSLGLGLLYNLSDKWNGSNSIYGDIRQGLPLLGYTTNSSRASAQTSRPGGKAIYTKLEFNVNRLQLLKHHFSLFGLLKGQYSFEPLLTAEQYAYGGSLLGRGYDVAELLGDKGLGGSIELRYDWGLSVRFLSAVQFYGFYEVGKVWNDFTTSTLPVNTSLPLSISAASTGGGIRFFFTKNLSGNLWLAKPLTKAVAAEAIIGEGHNVRGFFSIVAAL